MPCYVPIVVCSSLYGLIVSDIPLLLFSYSQGIAAASLDSKNPVFVTLLYGAMCGGDTNNDIYITSSDQGNSRIHVVSIRSSPTNRLSESSAETTTSETPFLSSIKSMLLSQSLERTI